jgi:hypothetical protein
VALSPAPQEIKSEQITSGIFSFQYPQGGNIRNKTTTFCATQEVTGIRADIAVPECHVPTDIAAVTLLKITSCIILELHAFNLTYFQH